MQQALDALKNGRNVRQGMGSTKLQISFENDAIATLEAELAKPEQSPILTEKDGSPCPEFWDWLPKAYNFEGDGTFTKYNMEVAFLAGKNMALAQPEQSKYSDIVSDGGFDPRNKFDAQPEQELDYPPECTTPELEVAYAAGWWKALEVQRNKQQALDKKADNARELGLDYEPDHGFDRTASHMAGEYVDTAEQEPVAWLYNGHLHECDPSDWTEEEVTPLYKTPTINKMPTQIFGPNLEQILNAAGFYKREWVGLTDAEVHKIVDAHTPSEAEYDELRDFALAILNAEAKLREKNEPMSIMRR